jgi:hypothetical protein
MASSLCVSAQSSPVESDLLDLLMLLVLFLPFLMRLMTLLHWQCFLLLLLHIPMAWLALQ